MVKKLSDLLFTLLGISVVCFCLIRLIPGDPILLLIGERNLDPQAYAAAKTRLGLDQPIYLQFGQYLKQISMGDFGVSLVTKTSVWQEFIERFPATVELGFMSLLWAAGLGIPMGLVAALKRKTFFDYLLMGVSLIGYSMPIFWWGLLLILLFSVQLGWTPVSGRIAIEFDLPVRTGFMILDSLHWEVLRTQGFAPFYSVASHLILPSLALGTIPLAIVSRMTRSSMLEVLGEDYVRTARAKGLSSKRVVLIHAFRNAMIPIVTTLALCFGQIITGAVLTETIFGWPGIGKWIVHSITARDYPVIQGGVFLISTIIVLTNLLVDSCYTWLNPRLRGKM